MQDRVVENVVLECIDQWLQLHATDANSLVVLDGRVSLHCKDATIQRRSKLALSPLASATAPTTH